MERNRGRGTELEEQKWRNRSRGTETEEQNQGNRDKGTEVKKRRQRNRGRRTEGEEQKGRRLFAGAADVYRPGFTRVASSSGFYDARTVRSVEND